jgi:hypothetical protein
MQGWPEPYMFGAYTFFFAGISSNIRSYTAYMYGSGQPYVLFCLSVFGNAFIM